MFNLYLFFSVNNLFQLQVVMLITDSLTDNLSKFYFIFFTSICGSNSSISFLLPTPTENDVAPPAADA